MSAILIEDFHCIFCRNLFNSLRVLKANTLKINLKNSDELEQFIKTLAFHWLTFNNWRTSRETSNLVNSHRIVHELFARHDNALTHDFLSIFSERCIFLMDIFFLEADLLRILNFVYNYSGAFPMDHDIVAIPLIILNLHSAELNWI